MPAPVYLHRFPRASPRRWPVVLLLWGILLSAQAALGQQSVRGTVIDDATGRGVPQAEVSLLRGGERLGAVVSDAEGRFFLATTYAGALVLEVTSLGYRTARSQPLELQAGDTLSVEFRILPDAILMEPLLITSRSSLGRNAFRRRQEEWGRGIFLGPEKIQAMELRHAGDVFRDQDKVRVRWGWGRTESGTSGPVPRVDTYLGSGCIKYMVDRMPVRPPRWQENANPWTVFPLDGLQPSDIRAVEIYRYVGEAPPEIRRHATWGDGALCGLVVFWTWAGW
ncbi:MAG: carboxypeptidase-like regulatory domain-containing protein [Gemmatimonadales bacterium]|nr:MAG: carboxypeptidase-like regulatory domain-containing protein [Gemmatimonadales bacterium]